MRIKNLFWKLTALLVVSFVLKVLYSLIYLYVFKEMIPLPSFN